VKKSSARNLVLLLAAAIAGCSSPPAKEAAPADKPHPRATADGPEVKLYVLDGGHAEFKDAGFFSDTGEYDGKPGAVCDACFLIRHPKGTLLWDTGLGDALADKQGGVTMGENHLHVDVRLLDQLKSLGLAPKDVTYLAFSHFHWDHTGNANAFPDSEWILSKAELAWALGPQAPSSVLPATFSAYKTVKTKMIDGDHDVFGDGSVRILKAPGHTPGHQVLLLRLRETGTVLLSGDLYHLRANREHARVPVFNEDRAQTLASFNRIETILKNTQARLIIQHDPEDVKALPQLPGCLR
jgi:glyoxylase-like metal-dependent hydrolase (beta-lactamase superfamily II)